MSNKQKHIIDGAFTAGGLLYRETMAVLPLLEQDNFVDLLNKEAKNNCYIKMRSEAARIRSIREIRKRFIAASDELRKDFSSLNESEQRLTLLYLCMKTYPLVFDMHFEVTIPKISALGKLPENYHYLSYIDTITADTDASGISTEATRVKLVSVYKRMLNEAGIVSHKKPVSIFVTDSFWCRFIQSGDSWFLEACFLNSDQRSTSKRNCT